MRINRLLKHIQKQRSAKDTDGDPADNAPFRHNRTKSKKRKLNKLSRGDWYGKQLYPFRKRGPQRYN